MGLGASFRILYNRQINKTRQNDKWVGTRELSREDLQLMSEYLPSDSDDKSDLGLSLNEEVSSLLGGSLGGSLALDHALDQVSVGLVVLGVVFLGVFLI